LARIWGVLDFCSFAVPLARSITHREGRERVGGERGRVIVVGIVVGVVGVVGVVVGV